MIASYFMKELWPLQESHADEARGCFIPYINQIIEATQLMRYVESATTETNPLYRIFFQNSHVIEHITLRFGPNAEFGGWLKE